MTFPAAPPKPGKSSLGTRLDFPRPLDIGQVSLKCYLSSQKFYYLTWKIKGDSVRRVGDFGRDSISRGFIFAILTSKHEKTALNFAI